MIIVSQDNDMIINFNKCAGIFVEVMENKSIIETILERTRMDNSYI